MRTSRALTETPDISAVPSFRLSLKVLAALWALVLVLSCVAGNRWLRWCSCRRQRGQHRPGRRARNGVGSRLDGAVRHAALGATLLVACARLVWLRDPRGWQGHYTPEAWQLLLRCPQCVLLGAWLVVILHWRTVASFRSRGGLSRALTWTPKQWMRITVGLTATLTSLVVAGVIVANNRATFGGDAQGVATRVVTASIGLYSAAFVVAAWFVGCRALRLYEPRPSATVIKRFSVMAGSSPGDTSGKGVERGGIGGITNDDAVQLKRWQIRCSLLTATPCALCLLALAVWRGAPGSLAKRDAVAFELYFEATHAIEWMLAVIIIFTVMPLKKVALFARFVRCCCCCCCCCRGGDDDDGGGGDGLIVQRGTSELPLRGELGGIASSSVIPEGEEEGGEEDGDRSVPGRETPAPSHAAAKDAANPTQTIATRACNSKGSAQSAARRATVKSRLPSARHLSSRARESPVSTVHTVDAL